MNGVLLFSPLLHFVLMKITTIGLDLAKHVFQIHRVDALGCVVEKRRLQAE